MNFTTYYHFRLPQDDDDINQLDFNSNFEIVDGQLRLLNLVTINGKALSGAISLTPADIGASASTHNHDTIYLKKSLISDWALATTKPIYSWTEIQSVPTKLSEFTNDLGFITSSAIPTKLSQFTNDSGFITSYTETDPTVPAWAKTLNKPQYLASEVIVENNTLGNVDAVLGSIINNITMNRETIALLESRVTALENASP